MFGNNRVGIKLNSLCPNGRRAGKLGVLNTVRNIQAGNQSEINAGVRCALLPSVR